MDVRDTLEQAELRRTARQLARQFGPRNVADLDDGTRAKRLAGAVRDAGWLELRDDAGEGEPLAGGVEAGIIADALAGAVADVAFTGPVLAADLARRAGVRSRDATVVAFSAGLVDAAVVPDATTPTAVYSVDGATDRRNAAYVLVPERGAYRLARVEVDEVNSDLVAWSALGLALTSADLVGLMRGVLDVTVAHATERRQYGVPIGSFQAVQHLLAEAHCLMEASLSVALFASWGVDHLAPEEARAAGRVAKAYCARAARTVCETAVQVHGGMGNTWECIVHVYLRRALLSSQWFGDDGEQLRELQRMRLGVTDGLS
jgi:Acyl-CoA dehydrogenase, C-terminal domain